MTFTKAKPKKRTSEPGSPDFKPLWSPKHGVTQGLLKSFLTCREQTRLHHIVGWSLTVESVPLMFGSHFHDLTATLATDGVTIQGPGSTFHPHNVKLVEEFNAKSLREFRKQKPSPTIPEIDQAKSIHAQVAVVVKHYHHQWSQVRAKWDWLSREQTFRVSSTITHDSSNPLELRGRFDGVFRDDKAKLWLLETKTKGQIDQKGLQGSLQFDLQTMLYCLALKKLHGENPVGVVYDVVRRPQLRRGKDESLPTFCDRIDKDIRKNPKWYFHQWNVHLSEADLNHWEVYTLRPMILDLIYWYEALKLHNFSPDTGITHHYLNDSALFTAWGRCDLFDLITKGKTYGLHRRKVIYPELDD